MKKEKSKRQPYQTRSLLIAASCLMGFFCLALLIRPLAEKIFYFSKRLPYNQRYQLTGPSYLTDWTRNSSEAVSIPRTDSVLQTKYRSSILGLNVLEAEITFIYYDNVDFADDLYQEMAFQDDFWEHANYQCLGLDLLKADHARVGCNAPFYQDRKGSTFIGQYGSCIVSVITQVDSSQATWYDNIDLIEDTIDPQMAAWDVCYPDRQAG